MSILDTIGLLVLVYTAMNLPIAVWMIRSFLLELPKEVLEAARASTEQAQHRDAAHHPADDRARPGSDRLICFIFAWNEFFFAVNLTATQAATVPVFLAASSPARACSGHACRRLHHGRASGDHRRLDRAEVARPRSVAGCGEVMRAVVVEEPGTVTVTSAKDPTPKPARSSWPSTAAASAAPTSISSTVSCPIARTPSSRPRVRRHGGGGGKRRHGVRRRRPDRRGSQHLLRRVSLLLDRARQPLRPLRCARRDARRRLRGLSGRTRATATRCPDSMPLDHAPLIEPLSCAVHGFDLLPDGSASTTSSTAPARWG